MKEVGKIIGMRTYRPLKRIQSLPQAFQRGCYALPTGQTVYRKLTTIRLRFSLLLSEAIHGAWRPLKTYHRSDS